MAQFAAIERLRQQFEKGAEIRLIEFFSRRKLPEQGTEFVAEFGHAGIEKAFNRISGLSQHAPVHGIARTFEREHEAVRNLPRPIAVGLWRLHAIERAIDLDRRQMLRGIFQFARMRQAFRVEHAAPWFVGPAADADADFA